MNVWVLVDREVFCGVFKDAELAMRCFMNNHKHCNVEWAWINEKEYSFGKWTLDPKCKMGYVKVLEVPVHEEI